MRTSGDVWTNFRARCCNVGLVAHLHGEEEFRVSDGCSVTPRKPSDDEVRLTVGKEDVERRSRELDAI